MQKNRFLTGFVFTWLAMALPQAQAGTFTSSDGVFGVDLPAGWAQAAPAAGSVLTLHKAGASIDIKTVACNSETCIEEKVNNDLAEVKRKNMQVVGNSYTGEEVKRIEFSTGEPFFYISFSSATTPFSAGYFLIDSHAYSVLAKNLSYEQTDLLFSFISPTKTQAPALSKEETPDEDIYNIAALPDVAEELLEDPQALAATADPATIQTLPRTSWKARLDSMCKSLQRGWANLRSSSLISPHMPPYIRHSEQLFYIVMLLLTAYFLIFTGAWIAHFWQKEPAAPGGKKSSRSYPFYCKRLYGTPSIIFRAQDSQHNVLVSLSSRWDSLFMMVGTVLVILTLFALALTGLVENSGLITTPSFVYHSIYAACALFIPLGLLIVACGIIWNQLVLREITLFDRKGNKSAIIVQKGFGILHERYEIYFSNPQHVLLAVRKRFYLRRTWTIASRQNQALASIRERSLLRACGRKLLGHLWGFLHADYDITTPGGAKGSLQNAHTAFNRFTGTLSDEKAVPARELTAVALLINIRDIDKWYPWYN